MEVPCSASIRRMMGGGHEIRDTDIACGRLVEEKPGRFSVEAIAV
ncbi:MAG: hypothetical protein ACE5GX_15580 [Thermoanaerobaculia bacterium]